MPNKDPEAHRAAQRAKYAANREKIRAYINAWRKAHPENRREEQRRYKARPETKQVQQAYVEANKEKITAYQIKYRAEHAAERPMQQRAYREANREAINARRKQRYAANTEPFLESARRSRTKHREKYKQARKVYYEQHKERILEAQKPSARAYYLAHRAAIRAKQTQREKEHPEAGSERTARRRARMQGAHINDLTAAQWRDIKAAYGHRCVYCGRKMQRLTRDHIEPLSKGGNHTVSNIVPSCLSCNDKKGAGKPLVPVQPLLLTIAPSRSRKKKDT